MSERTALITARRQSEDNLVRTIIQLSSGLIAIIAAFLSQTKPSISGGSMLLLGVVLFSLGIAIGSGLSEHLFSSKASEEQLRLVEQYYQKAIYEFGTAPSNRWVRISQLSAFGFFLAGLVSLGLLAFIQVGGEYDQEQRINPISSSAPTEAAIESGQARPRQVSRSQHATSAAAQK